MERTDRDLAVRAVSRWTRQFLISERELRAAITSVAPEPIELIRVHWRGRSRRGIVRQALTASRSRKLEEPLDPQGLDPWQESSEELAVKTLQVSRCRTCSGEKKVLRPACQGSSVSCCDACGSCHFSGERGSPGRRRLRGERGAARFGSSGAQMDGASLREIERQREAEAREAERARRRAEATRERAMRRWSSAPLLCRDGTLSPSCVCGGSRRGCCSWHGGVAGCSAEYPN